jgi:hypothetical protein
VVSPLPSRLVYLLCQVEAINREEQVGTHIQPQLPRWLSKDLKYCTETAGQMSARTPERDPIDERAG